MIFFGFYYLCLSIHVFFVYFMFASICSYTCLAFRHLLAYYPGNKSKSSIKIQAKNNFRLLLRDATIKVLLSSTMSNCLINYDLWIIDWWSKETFPVLFTFGIIIWILDYLSFNFSRKQSLPSLWFDYVLIFFLN